MNATRLLTAIIFTLLACLVGHAETYVVSIGVNRYQSAPTLINCENDAKAVAALFRGMPDAKVCLLTGRYATADNITQATQQQFAGTKSHDTLVFYFSGHGNSSGICPADNANGRVTFKQIAQFMKKSKARRKILIIDSCHSGASRNRTSKPGNGTSRNSVGGRAGQDVVLFMSSRANETSLDCSQFSNSLFTHYLLKGLKGQADTNNDRRVSALEIFRYVSTNVQDFSEGEQHPVMWGNFDPQFILSAY